MPTSIVRSMQPAEKALRRAMIAVAAVAITSMAAHVVVFVVAIVGR